MRYVATGGIGIEAVPDYLAAGADMVALGSAVVNPDHHDRLAMLLRRTAR